MSLSDEMALYTELTGEDGTKVPIGKLGHFLWGYEIGVEKGRAKGEMIHCKDCKYYHEDFWGEIDGLPIPIIIAHQVCSKWGDGCKTIENGYCHFGELRGE